MPISKRELRERRQRVFELVEQLLNIPGVAKENIAKTVYAIIKKEYPTTSKILIYRMLPQEYKRKPPKFARRVNDKTRPANSVLIDLANNPKLLHSFFDYDSIMAEQARFNFRGPLSEEHKKKDSLAHIGELNGMYGRKLSEEHIQAIANAAAGRKGIRWYDTHPDEIHFNRDRKHSDEYRESCSKHMKGKHNSPETEFKKGLTPWNKGTKGVVKGYWKGKKQSEQHRRKNSEAKKGPNHPNWGKHLPESTKAKIGAKSAARRHSKKSRKKMSESRKRYYERLRAASPTHEIHLSGEHKRNLRKPKKGKKLPRH